MTTPRKSKVRKKAHVEEAWAVVTPEPKQCFLQNNDGAPILYRMNDMKLANLTEAWVSHGYRVVRVQIKELRGR